MRKNLKFYKKYLMNHRYPFTALMLSIDSDCIDVNVHPTKMEVRFTNQEDVYHLFEDAISSALQEISLIPEVALEPESKREKKEEPVLLSKDPEPFETKRMTDTIKKPASKQQKPVIYTSESSPVPVLKEETRITYEQKSFEEEITSQEKPQFRIVGQVFDTYWLIEYAEELLIIDQHAAHEKVLYEKLMKHLSEKKGITQNLAAPVVVNLSEREIEVLQVNLSTFEQIGFQIEHFGEKDYLITGVPADFLNVPSKELFLEMLDGLVEEGSKSHPEIVLDHCATMACKAAVKGNHRMSYAEAEKLIEQMLMMDEPYHCPHGRPTTIAMSRQEFEKKFKRIV